MVLIISYILLPITDAFSEIRKVSRRQHADFMSSANSDDDSQAIAIHVRQRSNRGGRTILDVDDAGEVNVPSSSSSCNRRKAIIKGMSIMGSLMALESMGTAQPVYAAGKIVDQMNNEIITMPPPGRASEFQGVDNMYFPSWLEGEWEVTQTLVETSTPLGLKFIGGPAASLDIAAKSFEEQRSKIGIPVSLRLRWVKTKWGVCEDRLFNIRQRLDNFAGRKVVASVLYADVGGSNRASVLALGGTEADPLQTTLCYYKGPAAQKVFMLGHGDESLSDDGNQWAGFETSRSIFALTNKSTAPPVTTDSESIWTFERIDNDTVKGRLRLADFLNAQSDTLYFEARNRAVSLSDYTLELKRVAQ